MIWMMLAACVTDPEPAVGLDDPSTPSTTTTTEDGTPPVEADLTFWRDVQPVLAEHCVSCHQPGEVGPMPLQTFDEVAPWAEAVATVIDDGSMPPWSPSDDCRPLVGARSLSADERGAVVDWVDSGAVEGDPADGVTVIEPEPFEGDAVLTMPEPYTPLESGDDYRCFPVDWPESESTYVTGYQVEPGQREVVHHVLLYVASGNAAADARALDAADPGPGYSCFGSSGVSATTLGAWTPGVDGVELPDGTGLHVEPGSTMILQLHYNTAAVETPQPDATSLVVTLADDVAYPAAQLLMLDPTWAFGDTMHIGAGESDVSYDTTMSGATLALLAGGSIGTGVGDPVRIHRVGMHMHRLGRSGTVTLEPADGPDECLLDIPDWDFDWQGAYQLEQPVTVLPTDKVRLSCSWDNSHAGAVDVRWGDNTDDEMCISGLYVTR